MRIMGVDDPASRARERYEEIWYADGGELGTAFIYNVHNYWMFNVVSHESGGIGAVLTRALEPLKMEYADLTKSESLIFIVSGGYIIDNPLVSKWRRINI